MRATPLVSVVIPAWNAQSTIAETLRSAASQTCDNLEILIVDDGSTDGTAAVVEEFCRTERRARLIRKDNGGVASARNRAIAEAKGEWIAPLDADDVWHPTKIEKELAAALAAPVRPGFVYSWRRVVGPGGAIIATGVRCRVEGSVFNQLAYLNVVGCGSAMLASREAVLEAGGYDESLRAAKAQGYEDMLLQLAIARHHPVALVPQHLVGWRLHDTNMSSDFEQMARSGELMFRRLAQRGAPVPRDAARWLGAKDSFEVAQNYGIVGNRGAMLRWLGKSIRMDPLGTSVQLGYRALRSLRRRLGGPAQAASMPLFSEADPMDPLPSDPYEIGWFARIVEGLETRRLGRLAKRDAQWA